jgi:hypothetical protein
VQIGPSLYSNSCTRSLMGFRNRGRRGLAVSGKGRPRRRRGRCGEASPSLGAPTGARGLARDGPRWPSHVHWQPSPRHLRRWGAPATAVARKGARRGRRELEMAMTRSVGTERERSSGKLAAAKLLLVAMVDVATPSAEQRVACQGGGGRRREQCLRLQRQLELGGRP